MQIARNDIFEKNSHNISAATVAVYLI